ncbi:MAG TPA: hypothetical protein VHC69_10270 [Polyangiaceae bacterium]|nr:hypothetical protein [Polyangiaceae bacterium]
MSKEELQSTNEELMTVNEELQNRLSHLGTPNDDLQNMLHTASAAFVIVSTELCIRCFSAEAARLLNLVPRVEFLRLPPTETEGAGDGGTKS